MLCHASRVRDFAIPLFKKPFPYWNNLNSAMLIVDGISPHFINFVTCFSVASGNSLRRCSYIRSNDS